MSGVTSRSTTRAVALLTCFTAEEPTQRAADLARKLDMHPTTVWRYISALVEAQLLERDPKTGAYSLGLRILELSAIMLPRLEVRRHAIDEMEKVRQATGLLTNLAVLRDAEVVHLAHSFPDDWPRWNMEPGSTAPAHCAALGKVLLTQFDREQALRIVSAGGWRPSTVNSIVDPDAFRRELDLTQERGFAIDDEERQIGLMCVAVPILGASGKIKAAMSVTGRVQDIRREHPEVIADQLTAVARRISARLGSLDGPLAYL